ncbi:hypothetical protein [Paraburkholderia bannensis]|uniref:hypothetical protein n=1 Tax=Paraburkholderia bannensis TaxID=765414 RepID=UPI002AB29F99|nr:hypothetical protein [Paraburkholderia bannensis]
MIQRVSASEAMFALCPYRERTVTSEDRTGKDGTRNERMTEPRIVPDDFPRERAPGVVPGVQPKLLVRQLNEKYLSSLTGEELVARYDACADLAQQLADYALRKKSALRLTPEVALERVETGLKAKVSTGRWDLSSDEVVWLMRRVRELLLTGVGAKKFE